MRILWITWYPPWPPTSGGKIRQYNLINRLLASGNDIEVWCVGTEPLVWSGAPPARLRLRDFKARVREESTARKTEALLSPLPEIAWSMRTDAAISAARALSPGDFDLCLLSHSHTGALLGELKPSRTPVVLDAHNVEWQLLDQLVSLQPRRRTRWRTRLDMIKLRRLEKRLVPGVDAVIAVSDDDRTALGDYGPRHPVAIHPNGVDLAYFEFEDHTQPRDTGLLMTGSMGYPPNLDACRWISKEVMPAIRMRLPSAVIRLVGGDLGPEVEAMHDPAHGVEVVGPVPDMRPYYRDADAFLIPMRAGGGTRLKALEALASGVPVVSTTVGVGGLGAVSGSHLLIGETPEQLADIVVRVLEDQDLRRHLGLEGRRLVEARFGWDGIASAYERTLWEVVEEASALPK